MKQSTRYVLSMILLIFLVGCAGIEQATPSAAKTDLAAVPSATVAAATAELATASLATATPVLIEAVTATTVPTAAEEPEATTPGADSAAAPTLELPTPPVAFDGQRAYEDVEHQEAMGPRTPGSEAHAQAVDWMVAELRENGWTVEVQETTRMEQPVRNVIAKRGSGAPWTILGAHYDSRLLADRDPDPANHNQPVPGANDGASGVAVLMEMARVLPEDLTGEIWLAFFDVEDQGQIPGWDWILGSRALADSLESQPDAVIVVDMIGDADLNIYQEINSDPGLTAEVWDIAEQLGYANQFIPQTKYSILDDHTPFLEKGIRAIDIIDFDYPYWHTIADTADKVSPDSLMAVGDTVLHWMLRTHAP